MSDFNIYGVSRIEPAQFMAKLMELNAKRDIPVKIAVAENTQSAKPRGIVLFTNVDDALSFSMRHFKAGVRRFTPVVFDGKENMQKKHVLIIDDMHTDSYTACRRVLENRNTKKSNRFNANFYSVYKFVGDRIEEAKKEKSFITTYNGLLYSISSLDLRNAFKINMLKFLYGKHSAEVYTKNLLKYKPKKKTAIEKFARLLAAVSDTNATLLRNAVERVVKGEDVKEISEALKVPAYDIRYVLSQRTTGTKAKKG